MNWDNKVKIKHLFTTNGDHESIQKSMNNIADELEKYDCFLLFDKSKFRNIPKGDEVITPSDYANKLLSRMYDFADDHRIWIE